MPRTCTPSFVCELPLVLVGADERRLRIRLDCARKPEAAHAAASIEGLSGGRTAAREGAPRCVSRPGRTVSAARVRPTCLRHAIQSLLAWTAPRREYHPDRRQPCLECRAPVPVRRTRATAF